MDNEDLDFMGNGGSAARRVAAIREAPCLCYLDDEGVTNV